MRFDVKPQLVHVLDFVLPRRHDQRHVGAGQHIQALLQFGHAHIASRLLCRELATPRAYRVGERAYRLLRALKVRALVAAHLVVHAQRGGLVEAQDGP